MGSVPGELRECEQGTCPPVGENSAGPSSLPPRTRGSWPTVPLAQSNPLAPEGSPSQSLAMWGGAENMPGPGLKAGVSQQ